MNTPFHTWTWVLWLVISLIAISITRNLFYLTLILICLFAVYFSLERSTEREAYPVSLLRFGLVICGFSTLFNLIISHFGETVFFTLPIRWPLIGGRYTLEAAAYGLINGLVLFSILSAFTIFSQALPVRSLIRLIPRAFFPVAVVTSIAVTFVPSTIRQFYQIKEAQLLRGQRMKRLSDWLPLLMPLLVGGLERALQLSEAMTARGFASAEPRHNSQRSRLVMIAGLVLATVGWIMRTWSGKESTGLGLIIIGILLLIGAFWWVGRQIPHTSYLDEIWRFGDVFILGSISVLGLALFFPLEWIDRASLYYSAYPLLQWPQFDPWIGTALLALSLPAYGIGPGKS